MPGKNSILGEIEVNLPTIKRIVSSFSGSLSTVVG